MGTFGAARGTVGACRADFTKFEVLDARVLDAVFEALRLPGKSMSEESGVVGLEAKDGRRSDLRKGDGGRGVGGLL